MNFEIREINAKEIEEKYHISALAAKVFKNAELNDEQIRDLLNEDERLSTSHADCVLACCQRLLKAKENGEKVFVGGDYDADGICSTAIMKHTLDEMGIENGYYIPDRFREGYGLSANTVEMAYQKGYTLIMTVDNGVKAHEAIQKAKQLGLEIIITDHHRIEETVAADLVVHPDYMEEEFAYLSGAGVALEISRNLIGENDEMTALAAVAAIGDVMPLWKETRKIVKAGLRILAQHRPRSLYSLLNHSSAVNYTSVAFQIVPKLNSVGRMNDISNVNTIPKFLLCQDERMITSFAMQMEQVNETRKALSTAEAGIARLKCTDDSFLIIHDESFHEGMCGLVAGKLANELHKPVIVLADHENLLKGSGRGIEGFDMFAMLSEYEHFESFGGHAQAVGVSFAKEHLEDFRSFIKERYVLSETDLQEHTEQAIAISEREADLEAVMALSVIEPFPKEIPQPYFAIRTNMFRKTLDTPKVVKYTSAGSQLEAILYTRKNITPVDMPALMIGRLSVNRWKNKVVPQLEIEDLR